MQTLYPPCCCTFSLAHAPQRLFCSSARASTVRPPRRLPVLAALSPSPSRFNFRSIPYGSPPSAFTPSSSTVSAASSNPFFSLRCFLPPPRSTFPRGIPEDSLRNHPSPPPSLLHTTSANPADPPLSPAQKRERQIALKRLRKPYTLDISILASKSKVHKNAIVRERCKRRLREAIRMVVVRGAKVEKGEIVFDEAEEGPRKWLVPGFSYVASPTLELYRQPFPDIVNAVRNALSRLKQRSALQLNDRQHVRIANELSAWTPPDPEARGQTEAHDPPDGN